MLQSAKHMPYFELGSAGLAGAGLEDTGGIRAENLLATAGTRAKQARGRCFCVHVQTSCDVSFGRAERDEAMRWWLTSTSWATMA